ncbi:MAG: PD-(D/E)XK nuclease family protein, partial [Limisphaerales bacterium]
MDYETRHSNVLAWLLDPSEKHGFGTKFLHGFLSLVEQKMPRNAALELRKILQDSGTLKGARLFREFKRVDLLIVDSARKFVCLVENKIHTGEHSEQLTRYRCMVEAEFPGYQHLFVFLTLRSEAPSDPAYISLTYAELCLELKRLTRIEGSLPPAEVLALLFQQYVEFIANSETGTNSRPNVFSALRLREIKHSDFFAWLFNPRETHGLGVTPFANFLRVVQRNKPGVEVPVLAETDVGDWDVYREVCNIDLLVVNERARFVCLIENKLEAREGKEQLQRYKAFVREWYPGFSAIFVFFTLRGDKPSDPDYAAVRF